MQGLGAQMEKLLRSGTAKTYQRRQTRSYFFFVRLPGNHCKWRRQFVADYGSTHNEHNDSNCPAARRLAMVQTDTEVHSKGAACIWMKDNESVRAIRM
ncbi:hypothetical protein TNCV_2143341 [Trichonephila clavipes]|nr:hypothetical protein TNCV_2143341 [Trichonephila clavipes]